MTNITVYPAKASALFLVHPTHGKLDADGSLWPKDGFTARRLTDGSISTVKPTVETPKSIKAPVTDAPKS